MAACTDDDVGTHLCPCLHLCGLMNQHVSLELWLLSFVLVVLEKRILPNKVVFRLADVIPEVVLQRHAVELALGSHNREYLLFDHTELSGNPVDHRGVENVHSGVDFVTHEVLRLLDELVDTAVLFHEDNSETAWVFHRRQHNGSFLAMGFVEVDQLLERIVTDDVAVEHQDEARFVSFLDDLFSELERSGSADCFLLLGVSHLDFVLLLELLKPRQVLADLEVEVEDDFLHTYLGERLSGSICYLNLMLQHRLVGERDAALRARKCERTQPSAITTNKYECFHPI